ncbi:MAG: flagellin [Candidatus Thermoplasmatota archaeon]
MGKIYKKLKENDIGDVGIGAMIVFIAMVLVAGIAASVLIQTSGKLETQAMSTGQQTIAEVATGIAVEKVSGKNEGSKIVRLAIEIRPRAGTKDVDLSTVVVEISDSQTKNLFTYSPTYFTVTANINGDSFKAASYPVNNNTVFGVIVLEDADESCSASNPVINTGDHVILTVNATAAFGGLATRVNVFGMIIPEEGSPGIISFTTPAAYNDVVVELQ